MTGAGTLVKFVLVPLALGAWYTGGRSGNTCWVHKSSKQTIDGLFLIFALYVAMFVHILVYFYAGLEHNCRWTENI